MKSSTSLTILGFLALAFSARAAEKNSKACTVEEIVRDNGEGRKFTDGIIATAKSDFAFSNPSELNGCASTKARGEIYSDLQKPETINLSANMMVDCSFNGVQSKLGCLFDTGMNALRLPSDVGASEFENSQAGQVPGGCPVKKLNDVQIGGFSSSAREGLACPRSGIGFINVPALGAHIWKLTLAKRTLQVVDRIPSQLSSSPLYRSPSGHIGTEFGVGGVKAIGLLDTGSPTTLMDASVLRKFASHFSDAQPSGPLTTAEGIEVPVTKYKVTDLEINGQNINLPKVAVFDFNRAQTGTFVNLLKLGVTSVFGEDLLLNRIWYIDLKRNVWSIEPISSQAE